MKKSYSIKADNDGMRIDRWLRKEIGDIPQGLIEKKLRNGNIKINKKKVKSSHKIKKNDVVELFNFQFTSKLSQKKILYNPSNEIIKANEELIIDDNDDFLVLNKAAGISVQGGMFVEGVNNADDTVGYAVETFFTF